MPEAKAGKKPCGKSASNTCSRAAAKPPVPIGSANGGSSEPRSRTTTRTFDRAIRPRSTPPQARLPTTSRRFTGGCIGISRIASWRTCRARASRRWPIARSRRPSRSSSMPMAPFTESGSPERAGSSPSTKARFTPSCVDNPIQRRPRPFARATAAFTFIGASTEANGSAAPSTRSPTFCRARPVLPKTRRRRCAMRDRVLRASLRPHHVRQPRPRRAAPSARFRHGTQAALEVHRTTPTATCTFWRVLRKFER